MKMRRSDRELSRDQALNVIDTCAYAVMAMVNPDGSPYCIPLSMARDGDWLFFHTAKEGHKIQTLGQESRVCVSCVGEVKPVPGQFALYYQSAIVKGRASPR